MNRRPKGGKTAQWDAARAKIKRKFEAAGITRCEVCGSDQFLGFAHRKKRRFIPKDDPELFVVALLCVTHHDKIEHGGNMFEEITNIIEKRGNSV